ncbi:MAG: hypothetical protein GW859_07985 [Sphingomonadales bacterium]|nr:hypothetical protein [Sphingomonadales bacterium]
MNRKVLPGLLAAAGGLALMVSACSNVEGASEADIRHKLELEMDSGFEVADLDVTASENTGTEVEPVWRSRSDVEFRLTENFYKRAGSIDDVAVVRKVASKGDTISGHFITSASEKANGEWDIRFVRNDIPWIDGKPESSFGVSGFVVEGSAEHEAAIARQKEEADKEMAEKKKNFDAAKAAFIGTWRSAQPLIYRDAVWKSNAGMQAGYELQLDPTEGDAGTGTIWLYDYANPQDRVSSPVGYKVADDGETASIQVNESVRHDNMRDYLADRTWRLQRDGEMTRGSGRFQYSVAMKKQ